MSGQRHEKGDGGDTESTISKQNRLYQPVLPGTSPSLWLCAIPTFVFLENRPTFFMHRCKLGLSLHWEGCSHLEWIPHTAQQHAEPFLCCSVSSVLHQDCFVCHQVIKVADHSAVSGVVALKLGQQGLSLRQDVDSWCPHTPLLFSKIPSLPLPRQYREDDIPTPILAFLFSNHSGK